MLETCALFGAVGVAYKLWQVLTDEAWSGTEFPEEFRRSRIDAYWAWYGGFCHDCWSDGLRKKDLLVDHIVPIRRGGKNSKSNAQVTCRSCTNRKRDSVRLVDYFFGRS